MSPRPTRRGFLSLTGRTAAVAAGVAVLTSSGAPRTPAAGTAWLPAVTHPYHPAALYPGGTGEDCAEPLNAGVECGEGRVDA